MLCLSSFLTRTPELLNQGPPPLDDLINLNCLPKGLTAKYTVASGIRASTDGWEWSAIQSTAIRNQETVCNPRAVTCWWVVLIC